MDERLSWWALCMHYWHAVCVLHCVAVVFAEQPLQHTCCMEWAFPEMKVYDEVQKCVVRLCVL